MEGPRGGVGAPGETVRKHKPDPGLVLYELGSNSWPLREPDPPSDALCSSHPVCLFCSRGLVETWAPQDQKLVKESR